MCVLPLFGCLASMVSGYFIVYFTMLEQYFRAFHHYTTEENDFYFTLVTATLPVGAFLGMSPSMQELSSTTDLLTPWEKTWP
jgi:hypothetical protein